MKRFAIFVAILFSFHAKAQQSFIDTVALQGFHTQLTNTLIIGLGENGHGYETINETKSAFAKILHQQYSFQAIAFESSLTQSVVSFLSGGMIEARAKGFLYPFWNTTSVKAVLQIFSNKEQHIPYVVGFDIQEDCRFTNFSNFLIGRELVVQNKNKLLECDTVLSYYIGKNFSRSRALTDAEYALLTDNYDIIQAEINLKEQREVDRKLIARCIQNRKWLCKYLTLNTAKDKMRYRDSLMAENILWLQKQIYPDEKFIVWAANTHIAKGAGGKNPNWMGEWLFKNYLDNYFSVGFEKGIRNEKFLSKNTSYQYLNNPFEKFDLIIYSNKLTKIKPEEWKTPCD